MERTQILDLMGSLKLYGMRSAYDEVMAAGIKRQHEPPRIVGDLRQSEIAEKQARSIRYQMTVAKLPLAKDIEEFDFTGTPINEGLVRELANGSFVADQRNDVLIEDLAFAVGKFLELGKGIVDFGLAFQHHAQILQALLEGVATAELAQHDFVGCPAHIFCAHDFIGVTVFQNTVLMNP